jgi:hypothetical protein
MGLVVFDRPDGDVELGGDLFHATESIGG